MKSEIELLKMLRDYVSDPDRYIGGLCGCIDAMYVVKGSISRLERSVLKRTIINSLPKESIFYPESDSVLSLYIWERGDKQPRLEFLDRLIKQKAS